MELKLDEARVRVSSWSCKASCLSDVYGMFYPCLCLSLGILKLLCCLWCFGKVGSEFKVTQS